MPEGQKAGPKGRQLEVGAQRAPRLLVCIYLFFVFEFAILETILYLYLFLFVFEMAALPKSCNIGKDFVLLYFYIFVFAFIFAILENILFFFIFVYICIGDASH